MSILIRRSVAPIKLRYFLSRPQPNSTWTASTLLPFSSSTQDRLSAKSSTRYFQPTASSSFILSYHRRFHIEKSGERSPFSLDLAKSRKVSGYDINEARWIAKGISSGAVTALLLTVDAISFCLLFEVHFPLYAFPVSFALSCGCLLSMILSEPKFPWNLIFIIFMSFFPSVILGASVDISRNMIVGKVLLVALAMPTASFACLTRYCFWAASKGKKFNILGSILFPLLATLIVGGLVKIFVRPRSDFLIKSGGSSLVILGSHLLLSRVLIKRILFP